MVFTMPTENGLIGIAMAVIFNIILGVIWYSPRLLGKVWLTAYKFESAVLAKPSLLQYIGTAVSSLVLATVLWVLIFNFHTSTTIDAIKLGVLLWLGFIATTEFTEVLWEGKPFSSYLIDVGYWLVSLIVISSILTMWH